MIMSEARSRIVPITVFLATSLPLRVLSSPGSRTNSDAVNRPSVPSVIPPMNASCVSECSRSNSGVKLSGGEHSSSSWDAATGFENRVSTAVVVVRGLSECILLDACLLSDIVWLYEGVLKMSFELISD